MADPRDDMDSLSAAIWTATAVEYVEGAGLLLRRRDLPWVLNLHEIDRQMADDARNDTVDVLHDSAVRCKHVGAGHALHGRDSRRPAWRAHRQRVHLYGGVNP